MSKLSGVKAMFDSNRFQALVDGIKDCAIFMVDPDGHVISWNSGAERVTGYSQLDILGRSASCLLTPEDIAENFTERALTAARQTGQFETEGWRIRKDGTRLQTTVTVSPVVENKVLVSFAIVLRDVGHKLKIERELQVAREALQAAQRTQLLGRLTGDVAHEFGNLLTVVRSSADRLASADLSPANRSQSHRLLMETIDQATSLAAQLMTFSFSLPLRPEQFDVVDRLLAIRGLLETSLGDAAALKMRLTPDLMSVDTDRNQFEAAIINLVVNARDAMDSTGARRGTVIVSAMPLLEPVFSERVPANGNAYVAITVEDDGPGIPAGELEHIFEPFSTTRSHHSNAGFGLAQVHSFVRQSGGEVEVINLPEGKGTRFTLYLPRIRRRIVTAVRVEPPNRSEEDEILLAGTVLVVEDNPRVADTATCLLDEIGLATCWARDAEDALDKLQQTELSFDLVLTDIVMPGMSGIALARVIGRRWPELPVVLASGYSDGLTAGQGGEFDLIQKPYNRKLLASALEPHLKRKTAASG